MLKYWNIAFILLITQGYSIQQVNANEVNGVVEIGFDFGGDKIIEFTYNNGDKDTIKAHEGIPIMVGAQMGLDDETALQFTIGYKADSSTASNGEASFSRIPLDFMALKSFGQHSIGGGLTYHTNVKFECSVSTFYCPDIGFSNALGYIAQYSYVMKLNNERSILEGSYLVGARYTKINYHANGGGSLDGSGAGIVLGFIF